VSAGAASSAAREVGAARRVESHRIRGSPVASPPTYLLQVLRAVHPDLADHLARSVQTGLLCSYSPVPDDAPRWEL
jgi:hypothetical protein